MVSEYLYTIIFSNFIEIHIKYKIQPSKAHDSVVLVDVHAVTSPLIQP